jgi:hypothetical protein
VLDGDTLLGVVPGVEGDDAAHFAIGAAELVAPLLGAGLVEASAPVRPVRAAHSEPLSLRATLTARTDTALAFGAAQVVACPVVGAARRRTIPAAGAPTAFRAAHAFAARAKLAAHARSVGQHTADPSSLTQTSPSSQHRVHPPAGSAQQRTRGMQVGGSRSQRGLSSGAQVRQLPSALQQPGVGPTSHGPHSPCCWQRPQGPQFGSHTPVSGLQLVHDNGSQLSMHVPSAVQNSHAVQQLVASLPVQEVCPGRQPAGSQAQESWSSTCPAGQPRQRPSQQASPSLQQTVPHSSRSELSGAAGPHRAQGPLPLAASLMQLPRALPGGNTRVHQWAHSALLAVTGCGSIAAAKPPSKVPQRPRNSPAATAPRTRWSAPGHQNGPSASQHLNVHFTRYPYWPRSSLETTRGAYPAEPHRLPDEVRAYAAAVVSELSCHLSARARTSASCGSSVLSRGSCGRPGVGRLAREFRTPRLRVRQRVRPAF